MDEMKEIVDPKTVELAMQVLLFGGPLAGLVVGGVVGLAQRRFLPRLLHGLGVGCFGPLIWILWRYYSWTVRYDPATGYVGLHRVSVLLENVAVFVLVGALIGVGWGVLANRAASRPPTGAETATAERPADHSSP